MAPVRSTSLRTDERSGGDWLVPRGSVLDIDLYEARFSGAAFSRHRHDTYAIGVTTQGVQRFWYRGTVWSSTPGQIVVLHPDEIHDGFAGTSAGFSYRIAYIPPRYIAAALPARPGASPTLPFVPEPVLRNDGLRSAIENLFDGPVEPLALDALLVRLADNLVAAAGNQATRRTHKRSPALTAVREILDVTTSRIVRSSELERISGLSRFDLTRQFKSAFGTTPYRYSIMRRLEAARAALATKSIAQAAFETAFADQAHFTRLFKCTFGITPSRYAALAAKRGGATVGFSGSAASH